MSVAFSQEFPQNHPTLQTRAGALANRWAPMGHGQTP